MVDAAGFSRENIKYLVDKGIFEKSARGVYILPGVWEDEIFNLQNRFKRGIYSHETALFLWDLTDRTPNRYCMTFPENYNLTKPKEETIRCVQCKKALYDLGIAEVTTPGRNTVSAYSVERTLCDILRPHSRVDIQIVTEAYKQYVTRSNKNIPILSEYAKILKVEISVSKYQQNFILKGGFLIAAMVGLDTRVTMDATIKGLLVNEQNAKRLLRYIHIG